GDLLFSTSYDGSSAFWDPFTGEMLSSTIRGFARQFSTDGERVGFIRTVGRGGFGVWRTLPPRGYRTIHCPDGPERTVWQTDFSPDGKLIVAVKIDGVRVFDSEDGQLLAFQPLEQTRTAYFLPDGKNILVC